jgi:hypothetical protein
MKYKCIVFNQRQKLAAMNPSKDGNGNGDGNAMHAGIETRQQNYKRKPPNLKYPIHNATSSTKTPHSARQNSIQLV